MRVAGHRLRTTFRARRNGYLAVILLIGLVGGTAMASVAAGRRTQSSFPAFLRSTNPSDVVISLYGVVPSAATRLDPARDVTAKLTRLPGVRHVERMVGVNAVPLEPDGAPNMDLAMAGVVTMFASVDGLDLDQDRATVVQGRMANPAASDEFVTSAEGARELHLHLGQTVPFGFYGNAQTQLPGFGTARVAPLRRVAARLVGIVVFNTEVVQDDVDRPATSVVFMPALTRPLLAAGGIGGGGATYYGVQLAGGGAAVSRFEQAFTRMLPPGAGYQFHDGGPVEARVERAVKPEAIALGVFGLIAGVAALLIAGQSVARQLRSSEDELVVLRALGATPATTVLDGLLGMVAAVVLGGLAAVGLAVALSPLAPVGPVRSVYPSAGVAVDATVLAIGFAVLTLGLGALTVVLCMRRAPQRVARRARDATPRRSRLAANMVAAGLPVSGVVGVQFALEPGRGRTAVPVRSALVANALAVVTLATTLTFAGSLHSLVSRPALYGWNWSYVLAASNDVPPQTLAALRRDPAVAGWSAITSVTIDIDGLSVPTLLGSVHDAVAPPILVGHGLETGRQIVLGSTTLAQLHKHVGDRVDISYGNADDGPLYVPPTPVTIVGIATMPAIGQPLVAQDHTSMGIGALAPAEFETPALRKATQDPNPTLDGPDLVLIRMRSGVTAAAGRADVQRLAGEADRTLADLPNGEGVGYTVEALGVQRPAEIVNYRTMGATPGLLAAGLALGAVVSLGLTLAASVSRRRRDLALLKTMGFTRRQLAASIAWHASVTAVIGTLVGLPLGVAAGRVLWVLFAHDIAVVPHPTPPLWPLVLVAVGSLLLANLVAAWPGRTAARTPTALLLHAE